MGENSSYYAQIGIAAAKRAACFPGVGQLSNGETFKGIVIISVFSFSCALLMIILWSAAPVSASSFALLTILLPVIWLISVYDAYRVAVEKRRRDAKRFNVQIMTTLRGHDLANNSFEEITMTKNVSRLGACLMLSRSMPRDSSVVLEFEGRERVRGRVVWTRQAGDDQEHLVGMELMSPLKQFA